MDDQKFESKILSTIYFSIQTHAIYYPIYVYLSDDDDDMITC